MIECKFSLNLSKNGVQKTVYAKAGESKARMLIITLSHNGKVYEIEGHSAMVFLESGENFPADIVDNTVQAVIPNAFPEPQVRVCELRISKGDKVIYTPMFEIVFEVSLGNIAETESLVDGVQYIIKDEHDREDSHSISMIANLRDALDSKASAETVTKAFSDRDAVLDAYVKKTDGAITNLNVDVNLLKETSHSHSNKSALDKLSDKDGTLAYNDKVISGISDADKSMLEETYRWRHKHESASDGKNNLGTLNAIGDDGTRLLYYGEPLAYMSDILSNDLTQEQKENIKANTDARHTHKNKDILDCFGEDTTDFRPMYSGKSLALVWDVPTKTSHLENDSGFITKDDLPDGGFSEEQVEILNKLGESEGNLTYNGKAIGGGLTTDSREYFMKDGSILFDYSSSADGAEVIYGYFTDGKEVAIGTKISRIEIKVNENDNYRNIVLFNTSETKPIISMTDEAVYTSPRGLTFFIGMCIKGMTDAWRDIIDMDWHSIRITYYAN